MSALLFVRARLRCRKLASQKALAENRRRRAVQHLSKRYVVLLLTFAEADATIDNPLALARAEPVSTYHAEDRRSSSIRIFITKARWTVHIFIAKIRLLGSFL